ncbi:MAG: hypothetical protein GX557_09580 [Chloroflexi bacterium]|nr:hypothetical protein [Chloroflexota bacterium]
MADTPDLSVQPHVPGRPRTNASVAWQVGNNDGWHADEALVSPELRDVVQQTVSRGDWEPFDALPLLMRPLHLPLRSAGRAARSVLAPEEHPATQHRQIGLRL